MNEVRRFCEIVRMRTKENTDAIEKISSLPGIMMSVIRQELDSMIRMIYLNNLNDTQKQKRLISQTLNGGKWTLQTKNSKYRIVTDKEMVEISNQLEGWTQSVYKFGCAFIHLSNYHNYNTENPWETLSKTEQNDILKHLRYYHGGPHSNNPSFLELAEYFPSIYKKISGNLECYIKELESKFDN
jgi:hypothetical protein